MQIWSVASLQDLPRSLQWVYKTWLDPSGILPGCKRKAEQVLLPIPGLRDCRKCLASRKGRVRSTYRIILAQLNAIASNESWLSCYISHQKDSIEAPESKCRHQCSPCGMRKGQRCVNELRAMAKSGTKYTGIVPRGPCWDPDAPSACPLPQDALKWNMGKFWHPGKIKEWEGG